MPSFVLSLAFPFDVMTLTTTTVHRLIPAVMLACALLTAGCLDESTKQSISELAQNAEQMQQGAGELGRSLQAMQNNNAEPVEPVDFRALRDLIPSRLSGLEETNREGARNAMGGFTLVQASAQFEGPSGERVELELIDIGGAPGLSVLGLGMVAIEIDRESSTGFERTGTYQGHRIYEKFDRSNGNGEKVVLVDNRFVVKVSGQNTSNEALDQALQAIDISALESLRAPTQSESQ
jgi:hypothetical protein